MEAGPLQQLACIVSPNAVDADTAVDILGAGGVEACAFPGLLQAAAALDEGIGCLILVEEALLADEVPVLREALSRLPAWADPPLIVVSGDVSAMAAEIAAAFPGSGNVTLLERPLNPLTLVSAVQVALRAAARQRQVGALLEQQERAVRLRDEFLAMLAHELRNPLAPMRNALYMLRKLKGEDGLVVKNTEILDRQVSHVVRMVDDLMDVARLERGKVTLQRRRLDLNRVVDSAIESCRHAAQARGHRLVVRYATGPVAVDGDAVRLEQIVSNLVNNAAKFSEQPDDIRVATGIDGDFATVSVEDRGIGFPREAAEDLFQPFLQVNPTLERTAGGLGMGLTIVRRLAELHGGSVQAMSDGPGRGACFLVRLPLARGTIEAPAAARPQARRSLRRRRVAVIEDNADIRNTLQMLVTMWGHDVKMAADGRSGIDLVLRDRPDVALIDVGLPGMNGYDVARAIRRHLPDGEVRLVAITGYGQPADRDRALSAGFDAHLLKPIAPELLEEMLGA